MMNTATKEERIDVPMDLALRLSQWHSSMHDPVYAVSSSGLAKHAVPLEIFEGALNNMQQSRLHESHAQHLAEIDEIVLQMEAQLGRVENFRECVARSMSRTYWAIAWADEAEERDVSLSQRELLEVAPQTPEKALHHAFEEIETLEKHTKKSLEELYEPYKAMNPYDFGHEVATLMMGLGCSDLDIDAPYGSAPNYFDFADKWVEGDPV